MIGAKIYEYSGDFTKLFNKWKKLQFDTIFTSQELGKNKDFRSLAKENNIKVRIIYPFLFDSEILKTYPSLYALTKDGSPADEEWVKFVCPSNDTYINAKIQKAKKYVTQNDPDGINLDFLRFFVFWEKVYPNHKPEKLTQSCFDDRCLEKFQEFSGLTIPNDLTDVNSISTWILTGHEAAWVDFKCSLIINIVKQFTSDIRAVKPGIEIAFHTVPWRQDDFNNGLQRIVGQRLAEIAEYVDFITPMCYSHMVKQPHEWINSVVKDHTELSGINVVPSIQVENTYLKHEITNSDFEQFISSALQQPSKGLIFWSWEALERSPEKLAIAEKYLN